MIKKLSLYTCVALGPLCFVGCADDKPAMVADPNDYAPYQASPEVLQAQQAEAASDADKPKR